LTDEHLQDDSLDPLGPEEEDSLENAVQEIEEDDDEEFDSELFDAAEDEEYMALADPMIDKASRDGDDSDLDEALFEEELEDELDTDVEDLEPDDSELDENMEFDELVDLEGLVEDDDLEEELKVPLTASQQALAARRAIEERAEARRIDRDLNYLDFELDD